MSVYRAHPSCLQRSCAAPHPVAGEKQLPDDHDDHCSVAPNDSGDGSEPDGEHAALRARQHARASHSTTHSPLRACPCAHPSRAAGVRAQALTTYSGWDGQTWSLAIYQRHADELTPAPAESSDDELSADGSDEDDDFTEKAQGKHAQPLLLHGGGMELEEKKKKKSKVKNESVIAPRTIAELGKLAPHEIITQGSTFPSAEQCVLAIKELAARLKAPRPKVLARRGDHADYVSVSCACTAANCAFAVLAGTTRRRTGSKGDDQPAQWVVRTYVGHTCSRDVPAATAGNNDAQPKHVSAALAISHARALPSTHALACCPWCSLSCTRARRPVHIPVCVVCLLRARSLGLFARLWVGAQRGQGQGHYAYTDLVPLALNALNANPSA